MKTLEYYLTKEGKKDLYDLRKSFVVYCIRNIKNNKKYIGITNKIRQRLTQHSKGFEKNSNQYIHKSINKYGLNNFEISIIEVCENRDILNDREIFYIKKYETLNNLKGYNLTSGGLSGIPNEQTILNKIKSSKKVKIGQYDKDGNLIKIFSSVKEVERKLGIKDTDIHKCCKNKYTRNGFMFCKSLNKKITPFVNNQGINLIGSEPVNKQHTKVRCLKTNKIYEAESIVELCKIINIHTSTFHRNIKNNKSKKWQIIE